MPAVQLAAQKMPVHRRRRVQHRDPGQTSDRFHQFIARRFARRDTGHSIAPVQQRAENILHRRIETVTRQPAQAGRPAELETLAVGRDLLQNPRCVCITPFGSPVVPDVYRI